MRSHLHFRVPPAVDDEPFRVRVLGFVDLCGDYEHHPWCRILQNTVTHSLLPRLAGMTLPGPPSGWTHSKNWHFFVSHVKNFRPLLAVSRVTLLSAAGSPQSHRTSPPLGGRAGCRAAAGAGLAWSTSALMPPPPGGRRSVKKSECIRRQSVVSPCTDWVN